MDIPIRKLGNLFSNAIYRTRQERSALARSVIIGDQLERFAITVNIYPFHILNRKRWFTYKHDHQRNHLARIEERFRSQMPSVKLIEIHYELCPTKGEFNNIHFHALYEMPPLYVAEMYTYYQRICMSPNTTWKDLLVKEIFDEEGWIDYIRKDMA